MTPSAPEGGCDCGAARYRLTTAPLIVHCCHCRWCQRESGASFALNAMYESDRVVNLGIELEVVATPSQSGKGQRIARCPRCRIALWSHYAGSGPVTRFVRVGTLDDPDTLPPDVHIFTASKQPWVSLPDGVPAFAGYYERSAVWPKESLARFELLQPLIEEYKTKAGSASIRCASNDAAVIRRAGVADAPAYRDCVASVARERKYLMTVDGFSLEQTREFLGNIESAGWPCVMAIAGQRMIGWCDIMPKTVPGFTHAGTLGMGVLQEWRGQGIGRRLLGECLALGRTAGLERIELAVYADNNRAIRLYESMGFALEGRRSQVRKIDGQSQDELLMAFRYA